MATVAPQLLEDAFGTVIFTIIFKTRDSVNTTDISNAGVLSVPDSSGAIITGNNTAILTIQGVQSDVNNEMELLKYIPSSDFETNIGISYQQDDDQASPTKNNFMLMDIRNTHNEFFVNGPFTYDEDINLVFTPGQITDLALNKQYTVTLALPAIAGVLSQSIFNGTKSAVNSAMTNITFTPSADYIDNFTINYQQQQDTNAINQGNANININIGATHNEFIPGTTTFSYNEDEISNFLNIGEITDQRTNVQYQIELQPNISNVPSDVGILTNWIPQLDNKFTFDGTKLSCNTALSNLEFIPNADFIQNITMNYKQTQTTDMIVQYQQNNQYTMNIGLTHDEASLSTGENYIVDVPLSFVFGQITDTRPDNINPNIQYDSTISLSDPAAGKATIEIVESVFNGDVAYHSCNADGDIVVTVDAPFNIVRTFKRSLDGTYSNLGNIFPGNGIQHARIARNAPFVATTTWSGSAGVFSIYERIGASWSQVSNSPLSSEISSVDISDDGTMAVGVGASSGIVLILSNNGAGPWLQLTPGTDYPQDMVTGQPGTFKHPISSQDGAEYYAFDNNIGNEIRRYTFTQLTNDWALTNTISSFVSISSGSTPYAYDNILVWDRAITDEIQILFNESFSGNSIEFNVGANSPTLWINENRVISIRGNIIPITGDVIGIMRPVHTPYASSGLVLTDAVKIEGFDGNTELDIFYHYTTLLFADPIDTISGTKDEINALLSNVVFSPSPLYNLPFNMNYQQDQITDGVIPQFNGSIPFST